MITKIKSKKDRDTAIIELVMTLDSVPSDELIARHSLMNDEVEENRLQMRAIQSVLGARLRGKEIEREQLEREVRGEPCPIHGPDSDACEEEVQSFTKMLSEALMPGKKKKDGSVH